MTRENQSLGVPTRSDTNRPVQSQKKVGTLKCWVEVEEESYYLSSKHKAAEQLRSNCEADLRLCFRIGKTPVFSYNADHFLSGVISVSEFSQESLLVSY